eukprot:4751489-Pyramimonas_sp.AAC.1
MPSAPLRGVRSAQTLVGPGPRCSGSHLWPEWSCARLCCFGADRGPLPRRAYKPWVSLSSSGLQPLLGLQTQLAASRRPS